MLVYSDFSKKEQTRSSGRSLTDVPSTATCTKIRISELSPAIVSTIKELFLQEEQCDGIYSQPQPLVRLLDSLDIPTSLRALSFIHRTDGLSGTFTTSREVHTLLILCLLRLLF